jgi:DNA-binding transcriptional ArsR family regulator
LKGVENMKSQQLLWDWGTAYDLFASLVVLHDPAEFGLRGAWAAGVRARLPAAERETLEQSRPLWHVPVHWIYTLPDPKDGAAVLWALGRVPAAERLPLLALSPEVPTEEAEMLRGIAEREAWDERDREALRAAYHRACEADDEKKVPSSDNLASILDAWANAERFGERYLAALRAYQEGFFAEEESRIRPALIAALTRAQELAARLTLPDLLEELTQGLRFDEPPEAARLLLVPSYWSTPLVFFGKVSAERDAWLFGARPADASLVPGETVPESLLRALKALSDPTRLRILHDLSRESLTPAQLARRLRLRAPTVTHHLKILRLAGLVQMTLGESKATKCYAARSEVIAAACASLENFLEKGEDES